jgi:hypothetical protein
MTKSLQKRLRESPYAPNDKDTILICKEWFQARKEELNKNSEVSISLKTVGAAFYDALMEDIDK